MNERFELTVFQPEDAEGTVALFKSVYGEDYPIKSLYDPAALIRQAEAGDAYRAIAKTNDGKVVAHIAFYRSSPPNHSLYEFGQLLVSHDYRKTGVAIELAVFSMAEIPTRYNLKELWGEAVCNHLFTQQMTAGEGFAETGIEIGLVPGESFSKALRPTDSDSERISAVVVFKSLHERPQTVYLPPVYADVLRFMYEGSGGGHTFILSEQQPEVGSATDAELKIFEEAGVARITVYRPGEDFERKIAGFETEASSAGSVVKQVFIKITDPAVAAAVHILRRRGYFLGGVMPRWFGDDGLLMQKLLYEPKFDKIFLYTKRARQLRDMIRADRESVCPSTIGNMLRARAGQDPDKPAVIWPIRSLTDSFAGLDKKADQVAKSLLALGIGRGEHAAVWAVNIPEYMPVEFGCARAGVPLVMINSAYRAHELEYVLKQSDTVILFLTGGSAKPGEYLEALGQVREKLPALRHVVMLGGEEFPDSLSWAGFLAKGETADFLSLSAREQEVTGDDIFTIQYTSGTTGAPKGARQTHRAYLSNTLAIAKRQGLAASDTLCVPLPFFHAYGCLMVIASLIVGGTVIAIEKFRAPDMLRAMESHGATALSGTPTMFVAALEELSNHSYDLTSMRGGNMAGAFCPPDLVLRVIDRMHAPEFGILYGSTEGLVSLMNPAHALQEKRAGTVGSAMPGYAFKIIDPNTEEEVPSGKQGELCVKGPGVMLDYYRLEEMSAKTLDREGWLHSGDLASADADGYVFINGRIKDMIIRGGENVYPAEIEEFLFTHPKIADAQVVGIPCDYYGEDIVAFVRLKHGESATVIELKKYCRERIAINKVPATFFFVDQYPQTASGKVQKFKLRETALSLMDESKNKS